MSDPVFESPLFRDRFLAEELKERHDRLRAALKGVQRTEIESLAFEQIASRLFEDHRLVLPVLRRDRTRSSHAEVPGYPQPEKINRVIPASIHNRGANFVQEFRLHVPVEGDMSLLECSLEEKLPLEEQGSELLLADLSDQEVTVAHRVFEPPRRAAAVRKILESRIDKIEGMLAVIKPIVARFNESIREEIQEEIARRRSRLSVACRVARNLGYPLRLRSEAPLAPPVVPKPVIKVSSSTNGQNVIGIDMTTYDHILSVLESTAVVIERNPKIFNTMSEEMLRTHFLLQLNGHYYGGATGETFNGIGKTDILVRAYDKNLFVGECKIWRGPKTAKKALCQLNRYITWQDTKAALLLFNRSGSTTKVLRKMEALLSKHPSVKGILRKHGERGIRVQLGHLRDSEKQMLLTVLVFDVARIAPRKTSS